jgi:tetratricopeptide (TPR) repeat protein
LGELYRLQGRWTEAIANLEVGLEICLEQNFRHEAGMALLHLGLVYFDRGHHAQALALLNDARCAFQELGDRHDEGKVLQALGHVQQAQGASEQAVALWRAALEKLPLGDAHRAVVVERLQTLKAACDEDLLREIPP